MRTIVRMRFGSHLYGTATPASDADYKGVFVPSGREILLGRVPHTVTTGARAKAPGERNLPGDVDDEAYSLQKFLALCAEGQTVALDMLFAPPEAWIEHTPAWHAIVGGRRRLVTRKSASFLGYCRRQANKYGIKGSRVAAARAAAELLEGLDPGQRLGTAADLIEQLVGDSPEHMRLIDIEGPLHLDGATRTPITHWEVCDRKMPYTQSIKDAHGVASRIVEGYGRRALEAERNEGVDWKALSHAVRVGRQAVELLETGRVTLPRPEAAHLLDIKQGQLEYADVSQEIEDLLELVEAAAGRSTLPEEADLGWIDSVVVAMHREAVIFP